MFKWTRSGGKKSRLTESFHSMGVSFLYHNLQYSLLEAFCLFATLKTLTANLRHSIFEVLHKWVKHSSLSVYLATAILKASCYFHLKMYRDNIFFNLFLPRPGLVCERPTLEKNNNFQILPIDRITIVRVYANEMGRAVIQTVTHTRWTWSGVESRRGRKEDRERQEISGGGAGWYLAWLRFP